MHHELFFLPLVGTRITTPFVVDANPGETFRNVLKRAFDMLLQADESLRGSLVDISTASADLPVDESMFGKPVGDVVTKFGNSFCIKRGSHVMVA